MDKTRVVVNYATTFGSTETRLTAVAALEVIWNDEKASQDEDFMQKFGAWMSSAPLTADGAALIKWQRQSPEGVMCSGRLNSKLVVQHAVDRT